MERKITRTKGDRYCTAEIRLENDRLSICGEEGHICTCKSARKEALEYWISYFEEDSKYISEMNKRCGTKFRSPRSAAKYVLQQNGEYSGLDAREMDGKIYVLESCGQIVEELKKWFPELTPLLPWHLNDMKAGCQHQYALGWGTNFTVALTKHNVTDVQREVLKEELKKAYDRKIERLFEVRWKDILEYGVELEKAVKGAFQKDHVTIHEMERIRMASQFGGSIRNDIANKVKEWVRTEFRKENPPDVFDHAIYENSLGAPCPECGVLYGNGWYKWELPSEIIKLAETVLT